VLADFKVNRCTRRCHALSRPLRDGEWYYSVVIEQGDDLIRRDYSAEAWTEPPEGTVGWWKGRMPLAGTRKLVLAPDAVLVDLLRGLGDSPDRRPLRYLLALTLLRRRIVTAVEPKEESSAPQLRSTAADAANQSEDVLHLRVMADGSEIDVTTCPISQRQTESLQTALQELLYCEAPE
jgi:hypothetical protein